MLDEGADIVVVPATRLPFPPEEIALFEGHFPVDIAALGETVDQVEYYLATKSYLAERWEAIDRQGHN